MYLIAVCGFVINETRYSTGGMREKRVYMFIVKRIFNAILKIPDNELESIATRVWEREKNKRPYSNWGKFPVVMDLDLYMQFADRGTAYHYVYTDYALARLYHTPSLIGDSYMNVFDWVKFGKTVVDLSPTDRWLENTSSVVDLISMHSWALNGVAKGQPSACTCTLRIPARVYWKVKFVKAINGVVDEQVGPSASSALVERVGPSSDPDLKFKDMELTLYVADASHMNLWMPSLFSSPVSPLVKVVPLSKMSKDEKTLFTVKFDAKGSMFEKANLPEFSLHMLEVSKVKIKEPALKEMVVRFIV